MNYASRSYEDEPVAVEPWPMCVALSRAVRYIVSSEQRRGVRGFLQWESNKQFTLDWEQYHCIRSRFPTVSPWQNRHFQFQYWHALADVVRLNF